MWKQIRPSLIPLAIGITSTIIADLLFKSIRITAILMFTSFLVSIVIMLYMQIQKIVDKSACCGLYMTGLQSVLSAGTESLASSLKSVSKSYRLLGVSAERVVSTNVGEKTFKEFVRGKVIEEKCRFQFLLLNPEADKAVERHARSEGTSVEDLKERLIKYANVLKSLSDECGDKLQVLWYNTLPIFRIVLIDDDTCYVGCYGTGKKGVDVPQLIFRKGPDSFFAAFYNYFEKQKKGAKIPSA